MDIFLSFKTSVIFLGHFQKKKKKRRQGLIFHLSEVNLFINKTEISKGINTWN